MSYASRIIIKESTEELASLFNKTQDQRVKLKLKCLILFKEGDFNKQEDLANHLCIGYSTLRLWLKNYKQLGFDKFVMIPIKGRPKSFITTEIHEALDTKLKDSNAPLRGYWDAVNWLKDTMNVDVNYQALRNYMIKHFKTKLKVPRKSHYKKDEQAIEAFLKLPKLLCSLRTSLDKNKFDSVNLYFQDESRFGLMTHVGRCLTSKGVKPLVKYKHAFKNTYLYGAFSPIDGNSFVYEIEGTTSEIFYQYIKQLSEHRPNELMLVLIDNAGFHSLQGNALPENIELVRIPPYSPELNPSEKMWAYIKQFYKNRCFNSIDDVKEWLYNFIKEKIKPDIVKSITHHAKIIDAFNANFII